MKGNGMRLGKDEYIVRIKNMRRSNATSWSRDQLNEPLQVVVG